MEEHSDSFPENVLVIFFVIKFKKLSEHEKI